ncbi:unnamed protein product [Amoebophrya sp. A25]|nr:unnamed protein product [Amoebophrya sp. A25]|eukprot:GSA25T00012325001.1
MKSTSSSNNGEEDLRAELQRLRARVNDLEEGKDRLQSEQEAQAETLKARHEAELAESLENQRKEFEKKVEEMKKEMEELKKEKHVEGTGDEHEEEKAGNKQDSAVDESHNTSFLSAAEEAVSGASCSPSPREVVGPSSTEAEQQAHADPAVDAEKPLLSHEPDEKTKPITSAQASPTESHISMTSSAVPSKSSSPIENTASIFLNKCPSRASGSRAASRITTPVTPTAPSAMEGAVASGSASEGMIEDRSEEVGTEPAEKQSSSSTTSSTSGSRSSTVCSALIEDKVREEIEAKYAEEIASIRIENTKLQQELSELRKLQENSASLATTPASDTGVSSDGKGGEGGTSSGVSTVSGKSSSAKGAGKMNKGPPVPGSAGSTPSASPLPSPTKGSAPSPPASSGKGPAPPPIPGSLGALAVAAGKAKGAAPPVSGGGKGKGPPPPAPPGTAAPPAVGKSAKGGPAPPVPGAGKGPAAPAPPGKGAPAAPSMSAGATKGGKGGKGKGKNRAPPLPRSNGFVNIPWTVIPETAQDITAPKLERMVGDFLGGLYDVDEIVATASFALCRDDSVVVMDPSNLPSTSSNNPSSTEGLARTDSRASDGEDGNSNPSQAQQSSSSTSSSSTSSKQVSEQEQISLAENSSSAEEAAPQVRIKPSLWSRELVKKAVIQDRVLQFFKKQSAASANSQKSSPASDENKSSKDIAAAAEAKKLCLIDGKMVQHGEILWRAISKEFPAKNNFDVCRQFRTAFLDCTLTSPDSLASIRPLISCVQEALNKDRALMERPIDDFQYPHLHRLCFDICRISGYDERIDVMVYKLEFPHLAKELMECIDIVTAGLQVLTRSRNVILRMFKLIQEFGNKLNANCQAATCEKGFRLTSLERICDVRSSTLNATFLHFVVSMMEEEVLFTEQDCKALRDARMIRTYAVYDKARALLEPMQELQELVKTSRFRAKRIERRRETIGGSIDKRDRFHEAIGGFLDRVADTEEQLRSRSKQFFASYVQFGLFVGDLPTIWPPPCLDSDPTRDLFEIFDVFAERVRAVQKDFGLGGRGSNKRRSVRSSVRGRATVNGPGEPAFGANRLSARAFAASDCPSEVKNVHMLWDYIQACNKGTSAGEKPAMTVERFTSISNKSSPTASSIDECSGSSTPEDAAPLFCPPKRKTAPATVADKALLEFKLRCAQRASLESNGGDGEGVVGSGTTKNAGSASSGVTRTIDSTITRTTAPGQQAASGGLDGSKIPSPVESFGSSQELGQLSDVSAWSEDDADSKKSSPVTTNPSPTNSCDQVVLVASPSALTSSTTAPNPVVMSSTSTGSSSATTGVVSSQLQKTASSFSGRIGGQSGSPEKVVSSSTTSSNTTATGARFVRFDADRVVDDSLEELSTKPARPPRRPPLAPGTTSAGSRGLGSEEGQGGGGQVEHHNSSSLAVDSQDAEASRQQAAPLFKTVRPGRKPSVFNSRPPRKSLSAFADRVTQRSRFVSNEDEGSFD